MLDILLSLGIGLAVLGSISLLALFILAAVYFIGPITACIGVLVILGLLWCFIIGEIIRDV